MKTIHFISCMLMLCITCMQIYAQRSYLYLEEDTCSSCGQQIIGSTMYGQKMRGYTIDYLWDDFCMHRDSIVFTAPPTLPLTAHGHVWNAKRLKMHLPLHLQETYYEMTSHYSFSFPEYEHLMVSLSDYSLHVSENADSSFIPDSAYIQLFVRSNHFLNDLDVSPMPNRLSKVYFRNGVAILLLNIKQENYDRFLDAIQSFRLIEPIPVWWKVKLEPLKTDTQ